MKRKMIGAAAAYMAGLFFASFFTDPVKLIIFSGVIAAACIVGLRCGFKLKDIVFMAVFFAASVGAFQTYTAVRYTPVAALNGSSGSFCGKVTDVQYYSGDYYSYTLSGRINGNIRANVTFYVKSFYAQKGDTVHIGDCVFQVPESDYLFDSERYYKSDGIFLTLRNAKDISAEHTDSRKLANAIERYREDMISAFCSNIGTDCGNLLAGMVFGEKHGIDDNVRTAVYRSGIGHILAVSGLHVSVAIFILMWVLKRFHINKYISFALMECLLIFIVSMANYPISAIRAAIMMNFFYAAGLFGRQNDTFNSLAGAVLLICLFQPYSVYDEGFILSVAGTFGIGVFAPYMTKELPSERGYQRFIKEFAVMLCTTLCVFPFSLLFFDETSLISPVTNVLIIPLCSLSMIVGLMYVLTGGVVNFLFVSKYINEFVLRASDSAARIRYTHFSCDSSELVLGLLLCMAATAIAAAIFRNRRYICGIIAASLVFMFVGAGVIRMQRDKQTVIAVLGSGSNASIVVCGGGSADIIDLSGHYKSARYVRKYLTRNCISSVQTTVLTNKVQSSYSSYLNDLEYIDNGKWLIAGDVPVSDRSDITYFGENGFIIDEESYSVEYSDGTVTVSSSNGKAVLTPAKSGRASEDSVTVMYGNVPKGTDRSNESVIYLDDGNNFEIVLSGSDSCNIRRL
ncbi:ComEC/Rec2 family competence protein [Ruminococcus flavefaciens]|uniref:ComEC/Rec2 family competence protein n=1 Tax=Ruminococcus flavefaciens TaxID=1265 RepID=UPI00046423A9|nr:ComEC/Rec2 family competence protein [Ruminococcus flavefaciens]